MNGKNKKKTLRWTLSFKSRVLSHILLSFFSTVHIFNPIVHFSAIVSACLRFAQKKHKQWLKNEQLDY